MPAKTVHKTDFVEITVHSNGVISIDGVEGSVLLFATPNGLQMQSKPMTEFVLEATPTGSARVTARSIR